MSGEADPRVSSKRPPGTGTMSPTATSFSFVSTSHFEGSRGGRLTSRRHARPERNGHDCSGSPYTTPVDVNLGRRVAGRALATSDEKPSPAFATSRGEPTGQLRTDIHHGEADLRMGICLLSGQ